MDQRFDVIVIGSGFGGAITGCRLAEAGARVLILERGRRWDVKDFPRGAGDAWVWDQDHPEERNGWVDLRIFRHMAVVQGAGVGGGSLIYANISVKATANLFADGWPPEIDLAALDPFYDRVGAMMNVQTVPEPQWTARTKLMRDAAVATGYGDRFLPLEMAVNFDPAWRYELPDAHSAAHSQPMPNAQGVLQGTCVHLGNCDIGCDVRARNTLDLNYIARAEQAGAEVRPLHLVDVIEPLADGYRVHYDRLEHGRRFRGSVAGKMVIVAAGSLGSTELLLRCRDIHRTLPDVSDVLGRGWSSNGDVLTPAIYWRRDISPTRGPTISAAIDFRDGHPDGRPKLIEDGGFPDLFGNWAQEMMRGGAGRLLPRRPRGGAQRMLRNRDSFTQVMPWFAQALDAADGRLSLRKRWRYFGRRRLSLKWQIKRSQETINSVVAMHKRLARATGGHPIVPPTWSLAKFLVTPHPLGGCNMGCKREHGVVDHRGRVFGYDNLYVADGAIVPEAIGANPSRTIGALAERVASIITEERRL